MKPNIPKFLFSLSSTGTLPKRFYKSAAVEKNANSVLPMQNYFVKLDNKFIKSPNRNIIQSKPTSSSSSSPSFLLLLLLVLLLPLPFLFLFPFLTFFFLTFFFLFLFLFLFFFLPFSPFILIFLIKSSNI